MLKQMNKTKKMAPITIQVLHHKWYLHMTTFEFLFPLAVYPLPYVSRAMVYTALNNRRWCLMRCNFHRNPYVPELAITVSQ